MNRAVLPLSLLICVTGWSQPHTPPAEFEVASVKPSPEGGRHGVWTNGSRSHIQMLGMNVKDLICFAYDVEGYRVSAPGVSVSDRYDVNAKIPEDAARLSDDARWAAIHAMTQKMLADRFHLTLHHATNEIAVYVLSIAKAGSKIVETGPNPGDNVRLDRRAGHLAAKDMPMSQLVTILTNELHKPVLDETSIKGVFDVALDWAPENSARTGADALDARPSLFTALQENLGLKLDTAKRPIDVLVIDHSERPSEN